MGRWTWILGLPFVGCQTKVVGPDTACDTCDSAAADSGETAETADTTETADTVDTADTTDSADSADTTETADTADSWDPDKPLELCINEFMPDNKLSYPDESGLYPDWIELANVGDTDVPLDDWTMTDDSSKPDKATLSGGLVVPAHGFAVFFADGDDSLGDDHLGFKLASDGGEVGLYAPDGRGSVVTYGSIPADISAARVPDCCTGDGCWQFVYKGTPDATDGSPPTTDDELVPKDSTWSYWDQGSTPTGSWTALDYDDSTWLSGPGPLGFGDSDIVTTVSYGSDASNKYPTTYFRLVFDVADASLYTALEGAVLRDDGAIIYLNGEEIERTNMPDGDVSYDTLASTSTTDETGYTTFSIDTTLLVTGSNVLAAEVHQASATSSDLGFDMALTGEYPAE